MKVTGVRRVGLRWSAGKWRPCAPGDARAERVATVDRLGRPVVQGAKGWAPVTGVVPLDPAEVSRWLDRGEGGS